MDDRVDVQKFSKHLMVSLKGNHYHSDKPPLMYIYMQNSAACEKFKEFIVSELTARVRNGFLQLHGKIGEVDSPHLVMPLIIEPSKPRLYHDERVLK